MAVALVALLPRLDFALTEHPPELYVVSDMAIYLDRGLALTSRARTAWDTFTPVGYPAFLAGLDLLAPGDLSVVAAAQALFGALTAGLAAHLAIRLDRSLVTGAVAGLAAALYFPLIFYTGFLLTEVLASFLLVSFVALAVRALDGPSRGAGVAAGVLLGLAILVRPSLLAFTPFLGWAALRAEPAVRRVSRAAALAAALVLAPVCAHNSALLSRPALVASNGGVNFFLAFSDCRSVRSRAGGPLLEISTHYSRTHFERVCEVDAPFIDDGWFYGRGLTEIAHHPSRLVRGLAGVAEGLGLAPRRAYPLQAFWPGSQLFDDEIHWSSRMFFPLFALPAAMHGAALWRTRRRGAKRDDARWLRRIAWGALASVALVLYAFNGNPRVRVSSDPLVIVLAASAWVATGRRALARIRPNPLERTSPLEEPKPLKAKATRSRSPGA